MMFGSSNTIQVCCDTPVVGTLLFYKKEWVCVRCGGVYEFMRPESVPATPRLETELGANREEWRHISAGALIIGAKFADCEQCQKTDDYSHIDHAGDNELSASSEAWERITQLQATTKTKDQP